MSKYIAQFDQEYYKRFYMDPATRVTGPLEFQRLTDFVCCYAKHIGQPVRRVVDLGCGLGRWQEAITQHFPLAKYTGVEVSEYLCEQYGWVNSSVADYRNRYPYDLVICQDVLQYLPLRDARSALINLADLSKGLLYFTCLTKEDWALNCDTERTDGRGYLRTAAWYRRQLRPHFTNAGGGMFLRRSAEHVMFALETTE